MKIIFLKKKSFNMLTSPTKETINMKYNGKLGNRVNIKIYNSN